MARQAQSQANTLFGQSQGAESTAAGNAGDIYSKLFPTYAAEIQGEATPGTVAENTAAQQSVGGSNAGALGLGNLEAARTGNAGANSTALDNAVRSGQRALSTDAANIKSNEVNQGTKGLASLYGSNLDQQDKSLALGNQSVDTGINAGKSGWFQNFISTLNALKPSGSVGGGGGASFGFGGQ